MRLVVVILLSGPVAFIWMSTDLVLNVNARDRIHPGYEDSKHHRRLKNPNQSPGASEDSAVGAFAVAVP